MPRGNRPRYSASAIGYSVFTKGGYFSTQFIHAERKLPAKSAMTETESADAFKTLAFLGGKYSLTGDTLAQNGELAYHPTWAGTPRRLKVEITGTSMKLTSAPFKSRVDGRDVIVVTTWERVE
jgi:hypothetical protein